MNRKLPILGSGAATFLLLLLAGSTASAQTTDATPFDVTIAVRNSCGVAVNTLDFGEADDLTSAIAAATTGTITCTAAGPVTISFSIGAGTSYATRVMAMGANTIAYNLHSDAAATPSNILGDGSPGTVTIGLTSTGGADVFSIFGETAPGQNPKPPGAYSSTITATATF